MPIRPAHRLQLTESFMKNIEQCFLDRQQARDHCEDRREKAAQTSGQPAQGRLRL